MASRRMIDPMFWQSDRVSELTFFERLFYLGLLGLANEEGRVKNHPAWLRSMVFPYDEIPISQVRDAIDRMVVVGLIARLPTGVPPIVIIFELVEDYERRQRANKWLRVRDLILERDNGICQYCGEPANHVDHVIPRCQDGTDDPGNLVAACAPCNLSKGGRTPEQAGMELS